MRMRGDSTGQEVVAPPRTPGWAKLIDGHVQAERPFLAGAGLALLSEFVRAEPVYLGVLGDRLALRAAHATARSLGRGEDEDAIRDQWWLRGPDGALSPAARLFQGWRLIVEARAPTAALLTALSAEFDTPLSTSVVETEELIVRIAKSYAIPVVAAAQAADAFGKREPGCEAIALAVSDLVLAMRLGWNRTLPMAPWALAHPALRAGGNKRRSRPGDPDWSSALFGAYAVASGQVLDMAQPLALRARRLLGFAPKLRAKGATRVIQLLLNEACVAGSSRTTRMSDRAMRRIFDRLTGEGLVRELTGRPTFRLYGL